ncbi:Carotenoid oxygenase [Penicillium angulare]|uniref:Carotenoid oxygenase n=1 Tax=Penicillium angulare TaxID=116970 RepID=UPI00254231AD|nr:Carotenoid oxygenase [Penicillium angulare]KAJ5287421.1 Carotenoid oxygenase [Penicillium angulare]
MSSLTATETIPVKSNDLDITEKHWNNWPNEKGFDPEYEQPTPVELSVSGHIPAYAAGTLYRTGPGSSQVKKDDGQLFQMSHWFDGFAQTHRFQIISSNENDATIKVLYNSRFSCDSMIENIKKTGNLQSLGFGQKRDPCKTVFNKVQTEFEPPLASDQPSSDQQSSDQPPDPALYNVSVTLSVNMPGLKNSSENEDQPTQRWADSKGVQSLWAKTDHNVFKQLHPETLEPIRLATQANLHPDLEGRKTASHARSDPVTGDVYNYNLTLDSTSIYRVFHISASTGETTILAIFSGIPSYIHSLNISENFVILCVWNAHINCEEHDDGSFIDSIIPTDPTQPATWYIIDRKGSRGLVATYESPAFFAFHTIGAYEEPSKEDPTNVDIVADLVRIDSSEFIKNSLYENLKSSLSTAKAFIENKDLLCSTFSRFRLPALPSNLNSEPLEATLEWSACKAHSPELPTMNPKYVTRKYRYMYAVGFGSVSTFTSSIVKFDIDTQKDLVWSVHGHSPGEPIFVPNPSGEKEDDGVLLSVVLDGFKGTSYLLCLDAQTLNELGRANVNGAVGFGFHGQHVPSVGLPTGDY